MLWKCVATDRGVQEDQKTFHDTYGCPGGKYSSVHHGCPGTTQVTESGGTEKLP